MKVGDRVKFESYFKRNPDAMVDFENLTPEQTEENETHAYVTQRKYIRINESGEGIIAGKRTINEYNKLTENEGYEWTADRAVESIEDNLIPVYLIASNLSGFYRVPVDEVEAITCQ
jgi:hypothetical protein